jgi:LysR family nitrogen assimilation transcriptional regulator
MDLRKIRYFSAVVEHRTLSAAAQALRVSQPTLTRQVQALEQEFGTPLFVRHGRGVAATEAGRRLYEGLNGLERQLRTLKDDVGAASVEPAGEVAFGIPPSPRALLATPLIAAFCRAYPRIRVRVSEETSGELRDLVADGVLDLAVTNLDEPMRGVRAEPLGREQMLLIGPKSAKLGMQRAVSLDMLADLPLILTTRPNSLRLTIEDGLSRRGLRPSVRLEANTLPLMTDLVQEGLGYTVLPACGVAAQLKAGSVRASPITGFFITWMLAKPAGRSLGVGAERFSDMLMEMARQKIRDKVWRAP